MATLGSRKGLYTLGMDPYKEPPYQVISNGFWRQEFWVNKGKPKVEESVFPVDELKEQLETIFSRDINENLWNEIRNGRVIVEELSGEEIINSDSVSIIRQLTEEERTIQLLDQISRDDI